ncbi:tax1-binding protein 1 isoform X1 [Pleurodeles waltl]|uniref:tax1-binding protein 1 isoform X1 n=1 Tax=Pleurodeles waltl TaxID=8319 RepID=UPI00370971B7
MAGLQEIPSPDGAMQTSNFAHVIFQNVAKSYLPHTQLECHYTLTPYIQPNQKDWVGIFKVGWSTARDYYTFLWSPLPENYIAESTVNCVLSFQGYYLPNDDGEFYQFCYVTHKGEIRGASTPFQFRTSSPVEELLTMEDEGQSDMLVVTTKTALLELRMEKTLKEKEELLKLTIVLEKETAQLRQQVERLESELLLEKDKYSQLQKEHEVLFQTLETLKSENEELKQKFGDTNSKVLQLEEDIMTVTHKAITKETDLDSLKDRLKKALLEKEQLECQLKIEKDEKDLYKVHLKNTEIENTKLITEVQTLKTMDANRENMIGHYKEEVARLQMCMADKEKLQRDIILNSSNKEDATFLKEQLRRTEEQIQANRQEAILMSRELSDVVNMRDKTMSTLHSARLENEKMKKQLADARAALKSQETQFHKNKLALVKQTQEDAAFLKEQLRRAEEQIQGSRQESVLMARELSDVVNMRDKTMSDLHDARLENDKVKRQLSEAVAELKSREIQAEKSKLAILKQEKEAVNPIVEQELRREVEDLKLRLQMAADHYKEKFKECQKLQKQVVKLTEQSKIVVNPQLTEFSSSKNHSPVPVAEIKQPVLSATAFSSDSVSECMVKEQIREMNKEITDKTNKYKECKQMLAEVKTKCSGYADELAEVELKWKEQMKITETLKVQLEVLQDSKVQLAERELEIQKLSSNLQILKSENDRMANTIKALEQRMDSQEERVPEGHSCQGPPPGIQFFNHYSVEGGMVAPVPNILPELKFGNPYVTTEPRDGADGAFYPDDIQRPPAGTNAWVLEDKVVCSQPARNLSRPDGLEDPEESHDDDDNVPAIQNPPSILLHEHGTGFCFDSSFDVHKKCPLCDVMFPPNYDQSKFEEHVDSHWKVCPMCSEQFPPDTNQEAFERHVQTHFDSNVLNFD